LRTCGRRPGKEVIFEQDNDDKYIDVNDEPSDDDFVDMGRNSVYASGLRRSRRNKDKEVYEADHVKTVASSRKEFDVTMNGTIAYTKLLLNYNHIDKDSFIELSNDDRRFKRVVQHVESITGTSSELNKLKKVDLVFLPVDNEGHRFLLAFDLKYGAVMVFDQKKKDKSVKRSKLKKGTKIGKSIVAEMLLIEQGTKIGKSIVAEMLLIKFTCQMPNHQILDPIRRADFGKYIHGLDHIKAANMIKAELENGEYEWQTATIRPYAVFLMRIMETYMGKGMRNWDLRLDAKRGNLQKQLTVLCKKYVVVILMADCNMMKTEVRAHMGTK
ncbi:hypothetical protein Tco_1039757, partial [Tanacetum coccineum]